MRAYFAYEAEHLTLRVRLLEGDEPVITSELSRVEFASAVSAAARAGRLRNARLFLDRFDADCGDEGPIALIRLDPEVILPIAYRLLADYDLRTLDALHLAVASTSTETLAGAESITLITRDERQAKAAAAMGLAVG